MALSSASAFAASVSCNSTSNTLPWRTEPTPPKPRPDSACSIALPCGSSTPFLRVTVTRALITLRMLLFEKSVRLAAAAVAGGDQHRAGGARRLVLVHDAEAARHFLVRFDQPAHVAAEAVLVELVLGGDIPKPARVGRNLVGDHDAHHVALEQASAFDLEVDE